MALWSHSGYGLWRFYIDLMKSEKEEALEQIRQAAPEWLDTMKAAMEKPVKTKAPTPTQQAKKDEKEKLWRLV